MLKRILLIAALLLPFSVPVFAQEAAAPVAVTADAVAVPVAAAPVVVEATPATTEAIEEVAWWAKLADAMLATLATVVAGAVAYGMALLRNFILSKSKVAGMLFNQIAGENLEKGITNAILAEIEDMRRKLGGGTRELTTEQRNEVVDRATPKVHRSFRETLDQFGKRPEDVKDMVRARVEKAISHKLPPFLDK